MADLTKAEKAALEHVAADLRDFTGFPQWKVFQDIKEQFDSLSLRLLFDDKKKYALTFLMPVTEFSPNNFVHGALAVLEKAGLHHETQFNDFDATFFTPLIPGDHDSGIIVRGETVDQLKENVEKLKKHWKELPSFEDHFLASKTGSFLEWLKPMLAGDDLKVIGNIVPDEHTRLVNSWLKQLSRQVALKSHPRIAEQARDVLRIVHEHVPNLKERIEGLYNSSVPMLYGEESGKVYLTDKIEIRKAEKSRKIFMLRDHSCNWWAANISAYDVSYYFSNRADAEEFRLHAQDALYEIAKSTPEFDPVIDHDRPYLHYFEGRKEGILSPGAASINEDGGRFRIDIMFPLDLDELWQFDKKLVPYIKPTANVARQMLAAAKAEYRSDVGRYEPSKTLITESEQVDLNRGNIKKTPKEELLTHMLFDIAGMMIAGSAKPEETVQQVMNAAWWTMFGFIVSDDTAFKPMPALLPGSKEKPAASELGSEIQKRAFILYAQLEDMMRQSLPADVGMQLPEGSPIERLSKLAEALKPYIEEFDERKTNERDELRKQEHRERWRRKSEEWKKWHPEEKRQLYMGIPDEILALSDALANLSDSDYDPSKQLKLREKLGNRIVPFGEGEPPLVERVYHFTDWDKREVTYTSRAGSRSLQPPRLQLREELQIALDKDSPRQAKTPHLQLEHGIKIAEGVAMIVPEGTKRAT